MEKGQRVKGTLTFEKAGTVESNMPSSPPVRRPAVTTANPGTTAAACGTESGADELRPGPLAYTAGSVKGATAPSGSGTRKVFSTIDTRV